MTQPDHTRCIRQSHHDRKHLSWCGQHIAGWAFTGNDHAATNVQNKGRLLSCPSRVEAISTLLHNWTP